MAEAASISQGNFISVAPETSGFDLSSGTKWIYPENYPRRDYQFNIVQTALYSNTLVCLPTGLGKTFIAAVVMYNFWRWYPRGRVVFLAPTKPLVAQQINACHEIMGIPSEQTVELTGATNQTKRAVAWSQKRVIFATPQTFQKDLQNKYVPCELIKCVVFDEAHKALGKHSYCEIVRMVNEKNKFFRVLALSATPGSKIEHVREVIQNLLISELELRDDTSSDITPYTNNRSMEKIIVRLDKDLSAYKERYIHIMDPHVRVLMKSQVLQGSAANISKGRIFMLRKQYESRPNKAQNHGTIMKTLNILLTMYHAYELLLRHGLRAFYRFYSNHSDKHWLDAEVELKLLLEDIRIYIGDFPVIEPLDDGTIPDVPGNLVFGHNKFKKLQNLLVEHFKSFSSQNKSTRAIVFVEFRESVNEVYVLLLQTRPLIRPQMFVGQAGQKQKMQLAALEDFRNNKVNVLISTSVGEEGLDVGEVDLIVCFDISTSTPTRLIQRMGRTGRKRSGRVVLLLTEGKELQTLNQALSKKDSLNSKVLQSSNIASSLYQSSPRMVPQSISPECLSMFIKALPKTPKPRGKKAIAEKKPRKRKKDVACQENDDCLIVPSTLSESPLEAPQPTSTIKYKTVKNVEKPIGSNQPSMMKFLTEQRQPKKTAFNSDSGFCEDFQPAESRRDNPYSLIRPHEVRLLTSDSHALEFLTLCAMKKSEESSSSRIGTLKLNLKWAPAGRSASLAEDSLRALTIPATESLECIRHLQLSEINSEHDSFFPATAAGMSRVPRMSSHGLSSRLATEFSRREDEGIDDNFLDDNPQEFNEKNSQGIRASDFFCTFDGDCDERQSIVARKQPSQKSLDEIEISATDFFSSFSAEDRVANSTIKQQRDNDSKKNSHSRRSSWSVLTPANVEVDFEELLEELDSDCEFAASSKSPSPLESSGAANIFDDDLLEGGSSSDDQQQDRSQPLELKETARESGKRSASTSPGKGDCRPQLKRQKLSGLGEPISLSSNDGSSITGTPPAKASSGRSADRGSSPLEEARPQVDSDEDIFDGLDSGDETQFDFGEKADSGTSASPVLARQPSALAAESSPVKHASRRSRASPAFSREHKNEAAAALLEDRENAIVSCSAFEAVEPLSRSERNASVLLEEREKKQRDVAAEVSIDEDSIDQFDSFAATRKERVSGFFAQAARSSSSSSSSTGWIDATAQSQSKKQALCLKSWCANGRKPAASSSSSSSSSTAATRAPSLQLSNLKSAPAANKDQDGFAVPAAPRLAVDDKENKLPVWRERLSSAKSSNANVSPRFRKYRSESDLCSSIEKERRTAKRHRGRRARPKARKRIASDFIEEEAQVSSDCNTSEGSSGDERHDADLGSFVSYTQDVSDAVDMKAHYLQTINASPIRAGAFLIKELRSRIPDTEVFSQPVSREELEESYLYDSFCVGDETQAHANDSEPEESLLEKIESSLESRRRKMRQAREKKRSKFKCLQKNRKAPNSDAANDSSEDETEVLRKQIMEESMMLKR